MTKQPFICWPGYAQYLGMGRGFYDQYPIVKETIDQASQVLGYDLRHLIDGRKLIRPIRKISWL